MHLKRTKFNLYRAFFESHGLTNISDKEAYYSYTTTLMSELGYTNKRVKKEIYFYLEDIKGIQEIEGRQEVYNELFFNLPFQDRPLTSELAEQLGLSESVVRDDLYYLGLKNTDYQKTVKSRKKVQSIQEKITNRLSDIVVFPDTEFGNMVRKLGERPYQQRSYASYIVDPQKYIRMLKYEDLYYNLPLTKRPTIYKLATQIGCTTNTIRNDFEELGIYVEYLRNSKDRQASNSGIVQNKFENTNIRLLLFCELVAGMGEDSSISLSNTELEKMVDVSMDVLRKNLKEKGLYEKFKSLRQNNCKK